MTHSPNSLVISGYRLRKQNVNEKPCCNEDSDAGETHTGIAIIMTQWNNSDDTIHCLSSIMASNDLIRCIVVVDNGSRRDSIETTRNWCIESLDYVGRFEIPSGLEVGQACKIPFKSILYESWLLLVESTHNVGFARGNNIGIDLALRSPSIGYVMLLNCDTEVMPRFASSLKETLDHYPDAAAIQSTLLRWRPSEEIDSLGIELRFNGESKDICSGESVNRLDCWHTPHEVFGACAAACMFTRKAIIDVGPLDESLFVFMEDVDWSWRARLKGYRILTDPRSVIMHKRGISRPKGFRPHAGLLEHYAARNSIWTVIRYYPLGFVIRAAPALVAWLVVSAYSQPKAIGRMFIETILQLRLRSALMRNRQVTIIANEWIKRK